MILGDADFEDLVVGVNAGLDRDPGGRLRRPHPAAVFAFRDHRDRPLYWIYNYKRGAFYPFVPAGGGSSATTSELGSRPRSAGPPVEPELERWFPLWGIPFIQILELFVGTSTNPGRSHAALHS